MMNKKLFGIVLSCAFTLMFLPPMDISACTGIRLVAEDGSVIFAIFDAKRAAPVENPYPSNAKTSKSILSCRVGQRPCHFRRGLAIL